MRQQLETTAMLLGRLFISSIFLMSGLNKIMSWSQTADKMAAEGMIAVPVFLAGAIALEVFGGLCVLLGCWTRLGALMLIVFLIPTTLIFHDFWTYAGTEQQTQMINFMKNLAILGGLFAVLTYGPGRLSVDARLGSRAPARSGETSYAS